MTSLAGLIIERRPQRLRALERPDGGISPGIRLLGHPLVAYQLALLRKYGVTRVVLASHCGGALPSDGFARSVLILDGDVLTDVDVATMLDFHAARSPAATVMLARRPPSPQARIVDSDAGARKVDGGVYIVDAALLRPLVARPFTSGQPGVLAMLLAEGLPWVGWHSPAYWRRIQTPVAYHAAHMDLLGGRASMLVDPPGRAEAGSWIGDHVTVRSEAAIEPPCVVGAGVELATGARVGPRTVIGAHTHIGADARITESILGPNVVVGASAILDGCLVGRGARIAPFSILSPGAVLPAGAVLRSRTRLPR